MHSNQEYIIAWNNIETKTSIRMILFQDVESKVGDTKMEGGLFYDDKTMSFYISGEGANVPLS